MTHSGDVKKNSCHWDISQYKVNSETGFMLKDPLRVLPPYFDAWNDLASSLPTLVREKSLREAVHKLPLLDHMQLANHRQQRLAHLQLSLLTSCYVWQDGDKGVTQVLPKCLAVPFWNLSKQLGVQSILSHIDLALANWSLIDPNGPHEFENLECLYHLPGGWAADWFFMLTFVVELKFAKCLHPLSRIVEVLNVSKEATTGKWVITTDTEGQISQHLLEINTHVRHMKAALTRAKEHLDAKEFFNVIRPFLGGWGGEGSPIPDGLIFDGVSETPVKLTGGSAAQSSTLQVLDALLGVVHTNDKREFLIKMRDFMLPDHRRMIQDLECLPNQLRDLVASSDSSILKSSYNQCLSSLAELRNYHMVIVKMYIIIPSKQANEGNYESLDKKGTGGTSLIPFLKDIWSDTKVKLLPDAAVVSSRKSYGWMVGLALLAATTAGIISLAVNRFIHK